MGKRMDFEAYGKLNVILWDKKCLAWKNTIVFELCTNFNLMNESVLNKIRIDQF